MVLPTKIAFVALPQRTSRDARGHNIGAVFSDRAVGNGRIEMQWFDGKKSEICDKSYTTFGAITVVHNKRTQANIEARIWPGDECEFSIDAAGIERAVAPITALLNITIPIGAQSKCRESHLSAQSIA